jgi:hypothetical protein
VGPERQRYGCLEAQADGGLYRFEALPSGFTAELPVDADGLVIDYPGFSGGYGLGKGSSG